MKKTNLRKLKVHKRYVSNSNSYSQVPEILLKGKWLDVAGFPPNTYINVSCEEGMIVITPREPEETHIVTTIIRDGVPTVAEEKILYLIR